jgi:hypothetical protein
VRRGLTGEQALKGLGDLRARAGLHRQAPETAAQRRLVFEWSDLDPFSG